MTPRSYIFMFRDTKLIHRCINSVSNPTIEGKREEEKEENDNEW